MALCNWQLQMPAHLGPSGDVLLFSDGCVWASIAVKPWRYEVLGGLSCVPTLQHTTMYYVLALLFI